MDNLSFTSNESLSGWNTHTYFDDDGQEISRIEYLSKRIPDDTTQTSAPMYSFDLSSPLILFAFLRFLSDYNSHSEQKIHISKAQKHYWEQMLQQQTAANSSFSTPEMKGTIMALFELYMAELCEPRYLK
jgi:hypothetical protein